MSRLEVQQMADCLTPTGPEEGKIHGADGYSRLSRPSAAKP